MLLVLFFSLHFGFCFISVFRISFRDAASFR